MLTDRGTPPPPPPSITKNTHTPNGLILQNITLFLPTPYPRFRSDAIQAVRFSWYAPAAARTSLSARSAVASRRCSSSGWAPGVVLLLVPRKRAHVVHHALAAHPERLGRVVLRLPTSSTARDA
jgi:hypothetical protein